MRTETLQQRFAGLLETHVSRLIIRRPKAIGLCPFHAENTPSFSADLEKAVFHCFGCGMGGGVKDFALAVGEPWLTSHYSLRDRTRFAVQARRREAEEQARAILQHRAGERDKALSSAYRDAHAQAMSCADLLSLFHRRPDLAGEFNDIVKQTERDYSDALFQCSCLEAQLTGVVV